MNWPLVHHTLLKVVKFSRHLSGKPVGLSAIHILERQLQTDGLSSRSLLFLKTGSVEVPKN